MSIQTRRQPFFFLFSEGQKEGTKEKEKEKKKKRKEFTPIEVPSIQFCHHAYTRIHTHTHNPQIES